MVDVTAEGGRARAGGRGVLVTGASRGVGAATARVFAEHGDRVVVHYRGARERALEVLAGLHAFGQSMAVALAPHGIGVVSIAPGFIATDMAASVLDGPGGDAVRAQSPFGRVAEADEVARAIWALARPEAQWASGAVVDFNGASHLR